MTLRASAKAKGRKAEHRVARAIGGVRTPLSGAVGGSDVTHSRYSVEVKARAQFAFVEKAFGQAERDIAIGSPRRPLVVLKPDRHEAIYCLRERDFLILLNETGPAQAGAIRAALKGIVKLAIEAEGLCG